MGLKNLGQIKSIHVGVSAPSNTTMLWYDSSVGVKAHKAYNFDTSTWVLLSSGGGASEDHYRSDRITISDLNIKTITFSSALGSVDANIILNRTLYDVNGDEASVRVSNITKTGFSILPSAIGTLHYTVTLKQ